MVAGFIAPDGGDIFFDEQRMNDVPPHRRNTAMVFQSYALFPHMTVAENVAFGLRMRKLPKEEQAKRVDGSARHGQPARARATHGPASCPADSSSAWRWRAPSPRSPDILLFDEPLSNLDAKLRERVRIEIRELQRRLGITTLYVTHDQAEALAVSDRIVVMNDGRIEQVGDPDYDLPLGRSAASLPISSAPPTSSRPRASAEARSRRRSAALTVAGGRDSRRAARKAQLAARGHEARAASRHRQHRRRAGHAASSSAATSPSSCSTSSGQLLRAQVAKRPAG